MVIKTLKFILKLSLSVILISTVFTSCSKDNDKVDTPSKDHVKAKINGKDVDFKLFNGHQNNELSISVTGSTADINTSNENTHIQLAIISNAQIKAGQYELESTPTMVITYGTIKKNSDGSLEQENWSATTGSANPNDVFEIKIDNYSKTHVSGTFGGKVVTGASVVTVSEGSFSVPIN